jgi:acyl carrier protein
MGGEMDTATTIREYIVESFLLGKQDLDDDVSLIDSGIIDSTGAMEVVAFLEESFGISIRDEELVPANLDSVARLTNFVERKGACA